MSTLGSFIWSIADQLRGAYRPNQYGNVILPLTILRRLDCILEPDRDDGARAGGEVRQPEPAQGRGQEGDRPAVLQHLELLLRQPAGRRRRARGQPGRLHRPVLAPTSTCSSTSSSRTRSSPWRRRSCCARSSSPSRPSTCIPTRCSNAEMGDAFEYIIRKFNEAANETSGDHYTPRDAIRLMVDLLFAEKDADLTEAGIVRTLYDPTAGTGGMLSVAEEHLLAQNPDARLSLYGQEIQRPVVRDLQVRHDRQGPGRHQHPPSATRSPTTRSRAAQFDFCMSNPPYGVDWKQYAKAVKKERDAAGPYGRFAPGLPATSRRADALPAPPRPQDAARRGRRRPGRDRPERLAAVQRRRRVRAVQDPPLAAGERPGRRDRRAADQHVLQHRHRHLHLDPRQHQAPRPQGQGPAHRRHVVLDQDAQEPRLQGPRDQRRRPRQGRPAVRRLRPTPTRTTPRCFATTSSATGPSPSNARSSTRRQAGRRPQGQAQAGHEEARHRERARSPTAARPPVRPARSRSSRRTSTPR